MATITINHLIEIEKTIDILGSESIKRIKAEVAKREREMPDEGCNTCVSLNPRLLDGTDANMDNICTHTETTLGDILIGTSGIPCRYYESSNRSGGRAGRVAGGVSRPSDDPLT